MGVVEPPRAIAAGADIGEYPLMLRDLGAGEPRHDPVQPGPRRNRRRARPSRPARTAGRWGSAGRRHARRRCRGRPRRRWSGAGRRSSTSSSPRRACRAGSSARRVRGPAAGTASAGRGPGRTSRCPAHSGGPRGAPPTRRVPVRRARSAQVEVLIPQIFASSADVSPSGESASAPSTSITGAVGGDLAVDVAMVSSLRSVQNIAIAVLILGDMSCSRWESGVRVRWA